MRKKPIAVKVLRKWIKIQYTKELEDETGPLQGLYDPELNTITILMNKNWESTLYHEVLHCYLDIGGFSTRMGSLYEESLVALLETSFKKLRFNWKSKSFKY